MVFFKSLPRGIICALVMFTHFLGGSESQSAAGGSSEWYIQKEKKKKKTDALVESTA